MDGRKKTAKKGLTTRQEQLVDAYRACRNKTEAYRRVMPEDAAGRDSLQQAKRANALFTEEMMERVELLDQAEIDAIKKAMERERWQAVQKWGRLDSVAKLMALIEACEAEIEGGGLRGDKLSDVIEEMRKTIEALNKMLGYNAPEEVAATVEDKTVRVAFAVPEASGDGDGEGMDDPFAAFGG